MRKQASIPTTSYRPKIKRVGQTELPKASYLKESHRTASGQQWPHRQPNRISPELGAVEKFHHKQKRDSNNQKRKSARRITFWLIIAVIIALLLGAVLGIVFGLILRSSSSTNSTTIESSSVSTTTTTTAVSTITILCTNLGRGGITSQSGSTPTTWTAYSFSFTATKAASTILFGFDVDGTNRFYLDTVSVVNTAASTIQLLANPNFEQSATSPIGWTISCEMLTCGANSTGIQTASAQCSSGYCLESFCSNGRAAFAFLSQTFTTINANVYSISFMLRRTNIAASGAMQFYLDVL